MVGAKWSETVCVAPGAIVPLVGLAENPAVPVQQTAVIPVKVSVAFPLLLIVNVRSAVAPY